LGDPNILLTCDDCRMATDFSNHVADMVAAAAPSVVQVRGSRMPASGVVYGSDLVLTTARGVGRAEHPRVVRADGEALAAEEAGRDAATHLVLLKVPGLDGVPLKPAAAPRVGHFALAVARSWSNAVTATTGVISVIGGPLATGPRRQIEQVYRTSAPMHEGFAGGAVLGADGGLLGVATAAAIRGLGVVIPAPIAWTTAEGLAQHGTRRRGYLGISALQVDVTPLQREVAGTGTALLVTGVSPDAPAASAGVLVGDLLLSLDGQVVSTTDDLFDLLTGDRVGRPVTLRVLRGGAATAVEVTVSER
jgi:S1-C subfamily serine protease